ncbi:MAG: Crp/Fnr family transcriptional regulator [Flavobacterium sp.]|nr:Crp/Fnr family transcriptional regulator [Pedobacter sp.]
MFEVLFQNVKDKISLTSDEEELAKTLFIPKKLKKKQYLLQQDDVCKYLTIVEKGVLRSYTVDDAGTEHILQLALEGHWVTDMYSFLSQEPAIYNIDAVEDSELLLITNRSLDELYEKIPKFERFFRLLGQKNILSLQRRLTGSLSFTAEDKYLQLTKNFPDLLNRVPQHMIASYLGITRETLSRIKKNLLKDH